MEAIYRGNKEKGGSGVKVADCEEETSKLSAKKVVGNNQFGLGSVRGTGKYQVKTLERLGAWRARRGKCPCIATVTKRRDTAKEICSKDRGRGGQKVKKLKKLDLSYWAAMRVTKEARISKRHRPP